MRKMERQNDASFNSSESSDYDFPGCAEDDKLRKRKRKSAERKKGTTSEQLLRAMRHYKDEHAKVLAREKKKYTAGK